MQRLEVTIEPRLRNPEQSIRIVWTGSDKWEAANRQSRPFADAFNNFLPIEPKVTEPSLIDYLIRRVEEIGFGEVTLVKRDPKATQFVAGRIY